jgi:hypothetical protein
MVMEIGKERSEIPSKVVIKIPVLNFLNNEVIKKAAKKNQRHIEEQFQVPFLSMPFSIKFNQAFYQRWFN